MKKLLLSLIATTLLIGGGSSNVLAQATSPGTLTNTNVTVTSSSGAVIAAKYTRRYLTIQNNDATGNIYCTPTVVATTANGVKIAPGQMYAPWLAPNNAYNCIGDIASNANVVVTEGN